MDLKLLDAEPTDAEREAVDAVVGAEASNGNRVARRDRNRRHLLLPALRAAQRRVGWVTPGALGYTSRRLDVPPADAYGVATFYALSRSRSARPWCRTSATTSRAGSPARRSRRAPLASPVPGPLRTRAGRAADERRRPEPPRGPQILAGVAAAAAGGRRA